MAATGIEGPRACTRAELPEVIALVDEALGRPGTGQTLFTDYPLVYRDENLVNVRVLRAGGELAAVVPFVVRAVAVEGGKFRIGIVSPTATSPAHRRKGYGLQCLESCLERMAAVGCELSVLWTRVATFPFYEQGGYQGVGPQDYLYRCTRADAGLFADHGEKILAGDPTDRRQIEAIKAMHEREASGVVRADDEYLPLFSLPRMKTLLACRDDVPVGYLVVSAAVNKPGLVEAGGDARAVETLLHRALSELGEGVEVAGYGEFAPEVMGELLERRMAGQREFRPGPMMIRINKPRAFFGAIRGWLQDRNAGADREFSVAVADEVISLRFSAAGLQLGEETLPVHLEMSRRELTSVVFGAHPERPVEVPAALRGLFPFHFPIPMLDHS